MLKGLTAALVTCALLGACTVRENRTVVVPASGANTACSDYGFTPGTSSYDNCVTREAAARHRGRVARDYAQSALVSDSQAACASYGMTAGTPSYERCVRTEMSSRQYQ